MSRLNPVEGSNGGIRYWLRPPAGSEHAAQRQIPSVSSLVKTLHPFDNENYITGRIAEEINDNFDDVAQTSPTARAEMMQRLARQGLAEAREFGKAVHHYCEQLWTHDKIEVPAQYVDHVTAVADWWRKEKISVLLAEVYTYADFDEFKGGAVAGRTDLIVKHPKLGTGLLDLKTWMARSSGYTNTEAWAMQLVAYSDMDYVVVDGNDHDMPHISWHAVLHVGPNGVRCYVITPDGFVRALNRVHAARHLKSLPAPKMIEVSVD